jgi:carbohydrate-binding DOMON domain-containing protein
MHVQFARLMVKQLSTNSTSWMVGVGVVVAAAVLAVVVPVSLEVERRWRITGRRDPEKEDAEPEVE